MNYDFYKDLADNQQIWEVKSPVSRWNIFSDKRKIFATSVSLDDLAIDPTVVWDKEKLALFLRDILYIEMCETKNQQACYDNMLLFLKVLEIEDFDFEEEYLKTKILTELKNKFSQKKVTSVLLSENLLTKDAMKIRDYKLAWVYVNDKSLYVNPEEVINPNDLSNKLVDILKISEDRIQSLIKKREKKYIPIWPKLSLEASEKINEYIKDENQAISKDIFNNKKSIWSFVILESHPERYYPEKTVAAPIVWFLDNQLVWHYWLEWFFNDILKWSNWVLVSRKDVAWRTIDSLNIESSISNWEWAQIYTTIDRNIQKKTEEIIEKWVKTFGANRWTIVIMNPKTWAIISMANYPSYNPNNPWSVYDIEKVKNDVYKDPAISLKWYPIFVVDKKIWKDFIYNWKKIRLREANEDEVKNTKITRYKYINNIWPLAYQNDAISWVYEPGSIMKAITVAIWLDAWEINAYSMYKDEWKVTIDNFTIKNVAKNCLWYHTFANALNYSCNVWMVRIAQKYWKAIAYEYLQEFWFGKKTWITLEWETTWNLVTYEKWSKAQHYTTSYWLGISVTPLQMAVAYSVFANGWVYVKPHIVDYIKYPNWKILEYKTEIDHRVIKEKTANSMTELLVDSINSWVAKHGWVAWYSLAWKTWTAQIASKWWYEVWTASTFASFAWYWPAEDPRFVIIVKLERPRSNIYWDSTSARIFSEMSSFLLAYYKIPEKKIDLKRKK